MFIRIRDKESDLKCLIQYKNNNISITEAASQMGCSVSYLYKLRERSIQNGTWPFKEDSKEANRSKLMRTRKKEEERINQEIAKLRYYFGECGYTLEEIGNITPYSIRYLKSLRQIAIKNGMWYPEETEKEIIEKAARRKEREEQEKAKKYEEFVQEVANEKKKISQRNDRIAKEYKKYKKSAQSEDELEMKGSENIPTEAREKFIELMTELQSLGIPIPSEDINIVLNGYDLHPNIASIDGIRVLIKDANIKYGIEGTEQRITELMDALKKTKFYSPLIKYKNHLRRLRLLPAINNMQQQGLEVLAIANKLGLSIAEVNEILNGDVNIDFSDPDDMDM